MTPIEDLVREALAATPTPTTTDPLASLERRVRRARRRLIAGAGATAAAVVAAVVVPIAVLGGSGSPNGLQVNSHTPSPEPAASNPPGVTTWWPSGAVDVADSDSPGAPALVLVRDANRTFIAPVNPDGLAERYTVPEPADFVVPGSTVEWIVGTNHGSNFVRVSALGNASHAVHSLTLSGSVVGQPAVVGDSLYLLTADNAQTALRRFVLSNDGIDQAQPLNVVGATEIAVTTRAHPWMLGKLLVQVLANQGQLSIGATVDWKGDIFGPTGADTNGDDLWAYDGDRLIGLTPSSLQAGVSVAEGYRLNVAGRPVAVATADDGGLFVSVSKDGIYYYPPADVRGGGTIVGKPLRVTATSLSTDSNGGVNYVDDQGQLNHWDPPAAAGAR